MATPSPEVSGVNFVIANVVRCRPKAAGCVGGDADPRHLTIDNTMALWDTGWVGGGCCPCLYKTRQLQIDSE